MSRANETAFPVPTFQRQDGEILWGQGGLTIREHFACEFKKALITRGFHSATRHLPGETVRLSIDEVACQEADALIAELAKPVRS